MVLFHSISWLSNIPLYICPTSFSQLLVWVIERRSHCWIWTWGGGGGVSLEQSLTTMESLRQPAWRSEELRWRKVWERQYPLSPWIKPHLQLVNLRFFSLLWPVNFSFLTPVGASFSFVRSDKKWSLNLTEVHEKWPFPWTTLYSLQSISTSIILFDSSSSSRR